MLIKNIPSCLGCHLLFALCLTTAAETRPQYQHGSIKIEAASDSEPFREHFSKEAAIGYLENGAQAWTQDRQCISCHTNGSYLFIRPGLTASLGKPNDDIRRFFANELRDLHKQSDERLREGITPTQVAYLAAGLAEWDKHVVKQVSPETLDAIALLFRAQREDGAFNNDDCWPPLESSAYHGATVAAMALTALPEDTLTDHQRRQQQKLLEYLKTTPPPNAYHEVLLLWLAARIPTLMEPEKKARLIDQIRNKQHSDGGWSLRDFGTPESWAGGYRAEKLRSEKDFDSPASDGHMTGLAVIVLRENEINRDEACIQNALRWIKTHQRQSGRWWTRSLNTDKQHFITYSATCYALAALSLCEAL